MKAAIYFTPSYYRSQALANAMHAGFRRSGVNSFLAPVDRYYGIRGDAAVFYGFGGKCPKIMRDYRNAGLPVVNMDLGYWIRDSRKKMEGYNKVTLNARHPTAYFQSIKHPPDRFKRLGLTVKDWRKEGEYILVCGMSSKAANAAGLTFMEWERRTIARLRTHTDMPILYRPKPGKHCSPTPVKGATLAPHDVPIGDLLAKAHVCAARHSNACADALIDGVPVYCEEGAASVFSIRPEQVDNPPLRDGREQWAYDLAYCQWTLDEMRQGDVCAYLYSEGHFK